ncbi:MAG: DUF86 domain-containing protein [Firmicutes bacterium]|nr:DUF86 domain-containing protein [Bacillota bacterium]
MDEQDIVRLEEILDFCNGILQSLDRHNRSYDEFLQDDEFYDSVCMKIFQIGEISTKLTEPFRDRSMQKIHWPKVRGMRNIVAHAYGNLDEDRLWDAVIHDIPALKRFCEECIDGPAVLH